MKELIITEKKKVVRAGLYLFATPSSKIKQIIKWIITIYPFILAAEFTGKNDKMLKA